MLSYQLAAAHRHSLRLLGESEKVGGPAISLKMISAVTKRVEAYAKFAVALQRLQTDANQVVQVQHVQVDGQAVIGNKRADKEPPNAKGIRSFGKASKVLGTMQKDGWKVPKCLYG